MTVQSHTHLCDDGGISPSRRTGIAPRPPRAALAHGVLPSWIALFALWVCAATATNAAPVISEFMASNTSTLADDDGDFSDWIEIFNPDATTANLAGWYLTDSAGNKNRWQFPSISVPSGGYLLVFASNKNRKDPARPLHTNFSLDADGDYLALVRADGTTVAAEFAPTYPAQSADISYGISQPTDGTASRAGYLKAPTPRANNGGASALMLLEKVALSRAAGPFNGTFSLTLSGASTGQKIRYVLVSPSASGVTAAVPTRTSPLYSGPISISTSVIVRAAVFSADDTVQGLEANAHYLKIGTPLAASAAQLPVLVLDDHGFWRTHQRRHRSSCVALYLRLPRPRQRGLRDHARSRHPPHHDGARVFVGELSQEKLQPRTHRPERQEDRSAALGPARRQQLGPRRPLVFRPHAHQE